MMKNMLSKLTALITAFVFTACLLPAAFASDDFTDMVDGAWYEDAMLTMIDAGVILGDGEGHAMPEKQISRMEAAIMLARAFGVENLAYGDVITGRFTDVSDPSAAAYINAVVAAGLMQGNGGGIFNPAGDILRCEALITIRRALLLPDAPVDFVSAFDDFESVAAWAKNDVLAMEAAELFSGKNGKIAPDENITRAEFATLLFNAIGTFIDEDTDFEGAELTRAMIRNPGVRVENLTAEALLIAKGVGSGDVTLEGCDIGEMDIQGGGANSIHIVNTSVTSITVNAAEPVRVSVDADSIVEVVTIGSAGAILENEGTIDTIYINADNADVTTGGAAVVIADDISGAVVDGVPADDDDDSDDDDDDGDGDDEDPAYTATVNTVHESVTAEVTSADETELVIELSGELDYENNTFLATSHIDFDAVVDENGQPLPAIMDGRFTAVEINLKDILTALGYTSIDITQTNAALETYKQDGGSKIDQPENITEEGGVWVKRSADRDPSAFDDAFTVLILGGETATLVITQDENTFTVTIDATALTINAPVE